MPDRLASEVEAAGSWASLLGACWRLFALGYAQSHPSHCPCTIWFGIGRERDSMGHQPKQDSPDRLASPFSGFRTIVGVVVAIVDAVVLSPDLLFVTRNMLAKIDFPINAPEGQRQQGLDGSLLTCR